GRWTHAAVTRKAKPAAKSGITLRGPAPVFTRLLNGFFNGFLIRFLTYGLGNLETGAGKTAVTDGSPMA
ncbi:MAG: hypothetical protein MUO50_02165, partial [Longimicrobiales bacterium]|nr:hypothetical protein [Longimicrobiales bacterium]